MPSAVDEAAKLLAAGAHERGGLGEALAAAGLDLDLGRDELADEVLLELGAARGGLHLLEAVDELERLGVEERELLLDGDGEVLAGLESLVRRAKLLVGAEPLRVAHRPDGS